MPDVTRIEVKSRKADGKTVFDVWEHLQRDNGEQSSRITVESVLPSTCTEQIAARERMIEEAQANIARLNAQIAEWEDIKAQIASAGG